jgi:RHS repeat-associated protein
VTNLRLPGQYDERLLGGVGLQGPYYNWNRWYLPGVGRYLELDPLALAGHFNSEYGVDWYNYASANPLRFIDPFGLCTIACTRANVLSIVPPLWACWRIRDEQCIVSKKTTFEGFFSADFPTNLTYVDSCANWDDPGKYRHGPPMSWPPGYPPKPPDWY